MDRPRTLVECATAEEVSRALYQGHSITCSEKVAEQCGASFHEEGVDAFTLEEILASVFDPSVDGPPRAALTTASPWTEGAGGSPREFASTAVRR